MEVTLLHHSLIMAGDLIAAFGIRLDMIKLWKVSLPELDFELCLKTFCAYKSIRSVQSMCKWNEHMRHRAMSSRLQVKCPSYCLSYHVPLQVRLTSFLKKLTAY